MILNYTKVEAFLVNLFYAVYPKNYVIPVSGISYKAVCCVQEIGRVCCKILLWCKGKYGTGTERKETRLFLLHKGVVFNK